MINSISTRFLRIAVIAAGTFMIAMLSWQARGEIYRWVDDQGNVEYSDQPREGSEKIEVQEPATISLPKPSDLPASTPSTEEESAPAELYSTLAITFPENNTAFHSGSGDVTVLMEVEPSLYPNHSLRLSLDGKILGTTKSTSFSIPNLDRGTHTLKLDIVDNSSVVMSGPGIQFTIHRPSVNSPARAPSNN